MPHADVPPAGTGRSSLARRHPRRAVLLLLLLLALLAHRPILQGVLSKGLQVAAARHGLALSMQISGNLLHQCVLEALCLEARPGASLPLQSLRVGRVTFEYNLARLLFRGSSHFLSVIAVDGMELRLSEAQKPLAAGDNTQLAPEKWRKILLGLPLFWADNLQLRKVNISGADPQNGFALQGGTLTAFSQTPGVLTVESLRLPGGAAPLALKATTSFVHRRFALKGLQLTPSLALSFLELDAGERSAEMVRLQLEGQCGDGKLLLQLEAGPHFWRWQSEAHHIRASILEEMLGKTRGGLPDLVSAQWALGGDPQRPTSWTGTLGLHCERLLGGGGNASLECGATLEQGSLRLTHLEGRAPDSHFTGTGSLALPETWAEWGGALGTLRFEFASRKLGEWMPPSRRSLAQGSVQGEANAKISRAGLQLEIQMQGDSVQVGSLRAAHCGIEASFAAPLQGLQNPDNFAGNAVLSLRRPEYASETVSLALDEGACALTLEGGTARFWKILLKDEANTLSGEVSVPLNAPLSALSGSLSLSAKDLAQARLQVYGHSVRGALDAAWVGAQQRQQPSGHLQANGRALSWGAFSLGKLRAEASLQDGAITLSEGALEWSNTEALRASGVLNLQRDGAYDVQSEARLPNLERISPLLEQLGWTHTKVSGALEGKWAGTGSLKNQSGSGEWSLRIKQAQWEQVHLELMECSGRYVPGTLAVAPLRLSTKATKFTAQIDWHPGALRCSQIALEQWGHPVLFGEFVLPLAFDSKGVHWVEETQIAGQLRADKLDLATLLAVNGVPSPIQGSVQFVLTLGGIPRDPSATLQCSATGLRPTETPQFGNSSVTLEGRYARGALTATATAATPLQAPIQLSASLPIPVASLFSGKVTLGSLPIEARLQTAQLNLAPLLPLWTGLRKISGTASGDLTFKGSAQHPAWQGSLKAEIPLLHFASDRLPALGGVSLWADFSEKEFHLARCKADLGGGGLEILGAASFASPATPGNPILDFKAKAHEVLVVRNSKLALRLNGALSLKGPLKHAEISGAVSPTKSRVQRDIEVLPLHALRMEIPSESRSTGKPWFTLRKAPFSDWRFNVDMQTSPEDPVLLRGNRLHGSMEAEMRLEGTGAAPTLHGAYRTSDLSASLPFARVELSRGRIWYTRDRPFQPFVDFSAETEVHNHRIRLYLYGPASAPHISATSEPPEPETDLLTLIATGTLPGDFSEKSQALTNRAAAVLFQEFSGKVLPSGERERFSALRRFSLDLGALNNRTGQQETRLTYRLLDNLFVIGEVGTGGDFAGRVRYLLRFR